MAKELSSINIGRTTFLGLSRSDHPSPPSFYNYRPLVICMAHYKNLSVANIEEDILNHLKKTLPIDKSPVHVYEPMHYLAFEAPRTAAPALCIAACELVGGDRDQAMAAAAAIHLLHASAYTYENLPILTGSTRRGPKKPPIQHKYKPVVEFLIGGAMVPFGFELCARSIDSAKNNADPILRVIVEITQTAGCQGIIEGQYRELGMSDSETDMDLISYVCQKKEGELYACAAACGTILGGGSEEVIERLRKYELYVGIVQGLLHGAGKDIDGIQGIAKKAFMVKNSRASAREALEIFKVSKIETICSFLKT